MFAFTRAHVVQREDLTQAGDKAGGFVWNAESNVHSVSFVYSCIYLSNEIGSTAMHGHGAEKPQLSGTMIHKQTICLDSSNYVKYTAEIPTDSKELGLPKHTFTQNAVNKQFFCV